MFFLFPLGISQEFCSLTMLLGFSLPSAQIGRLGRYQQQLHVLGEMAHSIAVDISATRADLGYEPAVDLATGMRTSIRWCLDQGYQL